MNRLAFITSKKPTQAETGISGSFGLGERNKVGNYLVQFQIMRTWFKQHKCRFYSWTSPNKLHCNQINYVLCSHCWSSSVLTFKTYPGVDYYELWLRSEWNYAISKRQHHQRHLISPKSLPCMQMRWEIGLNHWILLRRYPTNYGKKFNYLSLKQQLNTLPYKNPEKTPEWPSD